MKLTKTFKTVLTLALLLTTGLLLVGCKKPLEPPVELPEDSIPWTPLEPATPKEEEEELNKPVKPEGDLNYVDFGDNFERGVFQTITVDTKDFKEIIITILGESKYDIPVNLNHFKVDNETVDFNGVSGTTYVVDHDFKIGELNAVGRMINTHKNNEIQDLRLHTMHATHGTEHFIKVDVTNVDTFEFQFAVTTGAFAYLEAVRIEFK